MSKYLSKKLIFKIKNKNCNFFLLEKIQKLNKMNEELENVNEKLLKQIELTENEFKNTQTHSYQEHFKKMFLKFLEQGHKYTQIIK